MEEEWLSVITETNASNMGTVATLIWPPSKVNDSQIAKNGTEQPEPFDEVDPSFSATVETGSQTEEQSNEHNVQLNETSEKIESVECIGMEADTTTSNIVLDNSDRKQCSICKKRFTRSSYVKIHMKIHRQEKLFKCLECKNVFPEKQKLFEHITVVHRNLKVFKCDYDLCRYFTKRSNDLKRHKLSHTRKFLFKCKKCVKAFPEKGDLNRHKKTKQCMMKRGKLTTKSE